MRGLVITQVILTAVALSGCGIFTEDQPLEISTDRSVYPRGTTMNVTAKNVSKDVLYYNSCMPTVMEELADGTIAKETSFPVCQCLCITELKPGQTWEWGLDVDWLWANEGLFEPNTGRRHRFRFAFYEDAKLKRVLDREDLRTNAFRFRPQTR